MSSEIQGGPRRAFRFGVVAAAARTGEEWTSNVRDIESMGYATVGVPDGLRYTLAPLPALAAAAAATRTLRLGTYVIANDYRNPVMLAKEAATVDLLSDGRLELGIGVGRPDAEQDNRMLGMEFDSGGVRVARLAEALALLKTLLSGRQADAAGPHYRAAAAEVGPGPVQQPHPPILIAGSGRRMLRLAAREADIIALGVPPMATEAEVGERVGWVREAAGSRFADIELNMNLMAVGEQVARYFAMQHGVTAESMAQSGSASVAVGTTDEVCETLQRRRERLGISYFMVGDELKEAFAPVVERLAGT
jgi:probable F420-dependent oxidoreductase